MNKQEFLSAFQRAMDALGVKDQTAHYAFFEELFDDMTEEGVSEAEISARLGNPWELAASLLREELGAAETGSRERNAAARSETPFSSGEDQMKAVGTDHWMQPSPTDAQGQNAGSASPEEEGRGSSRPSWRDKLSRLLNTAGIKLVINGEHFGNVDSFDTVIPANGIDELEIHWMAGALDVCSEDREDILLTEDRCDNASPMRVEVRGSCLCVFYAQDGSFLGSKDLNVTLPTELASHLERCTVQTLSADTTLNGLVVHEVSVKTASGEQDICLSADRAVLTSASGNLELKMDAREITASTASGDLELTAQGAELAKLTSASGDINCFGSMRRLSMNSASGDMEFSGDATCIQAKTASGDCNLDLRQAPEEMSLSSVSGDVEVTLPHGAACHLQLNSRTGDVSFSGIRTDVQDAPVYRVQTVSGDIDIHA